MINNHQEFEINDLFVFITNVTRVLQPGSIAENVLLSALKLKSGRGTLAHQSTANASDEEI